MTKENTAAKNRPWPVIIMLGMLALVIGLGFILSPNSESDKLWWIRFLGTTNHGVLLNPPVQIGLEDLRQEDDLDWSALNNDTFKLVVVNFGSCDADCTEMLLTTRQLHVRLNRDYEDVERGFLAPDLSVQEINALLESYPGYSILRLQGPELLDRLAGTNIPPLSEGPTLLMIDPANLAMMVYNSEHSGSQILEDLEHLLELAR